MHCSLPVISFLVKCLSFRNRAFCLMDKVSLLHLKFTLLPYCLCIAITSPLHHYLLYSAHRIVIDKRGNGEEEVVDHN